MLIEFVLSAFLLGSVIQDLMKSRLPNYYLLSGLLVALILQIWFAGWVGLMNCGAGLLAGFLLFIPLYAFGGMAAGDVKMMAVVGCFLDMPSALWAGAYSLMAGGVLGVAYLLYRGHFGKLLLRYWAMASLRARIPAEDGDAARHRFPYAVAIAAGTLLSLFWKPI